MSVEISGRQEFLNRYFDADLALPKTNIEELIETQVIRLSRALVVTIHAGSIPRRLGGDATDQDLAIDRKRAKRSSWAVKQALAGWSKKMPKLPTDDELRVTGAQLIWPNWQEQYMASLLEQARIVATWSILNDEQRWGRSAVVKFDNEQNWISYALRD